MTATPPFDPPYKMQDASLGDGRWVEVHADGTRTETTAPPAGLHLPAGAPSRPAPSGAGSKSRPTTAGTFLNVPFAEKDEAKQLGARWDAAKKKWYVPQGVDLEGFSRWTLR